MSSEVVDLHICICICTSYCFYLCRLRLCTAATLQWPAAPPTTHRHSFLAMLTCLHLFATVWREVTWPPQCSNWGRDFSTLFKSDIVQWRSTVLWILQRRRARSSCSVCCGWCDWRRPLSRSAVLFATLWHCRELSYEWYAHHIQFEFWLLRRLTPAVTDHPPPDLRRQQSIPSVSSTTQLSQCVCCSALAARC